MQLRVTSVICLIALAALGAAATVNAQDGPGAVYTLTNAPSGNAVVRYARSAQGLLVPAGQFPTGANGSGAGLGSQGAVIASDDHHFLFAVNAGSNSISSFRIVPNGLELADTVASGGVLPTSVTFSRGLLYVLNAGAPNSITGFEVDRRGRFTMLAGSTRPLSGTSTAPAQIQFSDDGKALIVTERATNMIDVYAVGDDGLTAGPFSFPSSGPTPFGFAVDKRNVLFVSEAGAGGGASTYAIGAEPSLTPLSSNVMTGQRAACWAIVTKNGRFGYVTNAGTGNISGFRIDKDGTATLLDASGVTAVTGGNPTDMAMSENSAFLFARVAALNAIAVFRVESDGSLTPLPSLTGTLAGLAGLAAY